MFIRVIHSQNPRPSIPVPFLHLLRRHIPLRHIRALNDRLALANLLRPLLHRGELTQVDLQRCRARSHPRVIRNVGNSVLTPGQERAVLEPRLEHSIQPLRLVDVPLDAVVRARAREEGEVVCLAFSSSVLPFNPGGGYSPCIGPNPPIWNINQESCSIYSGEPGA